jgi:hypothetical protein
VKKIVLYLMVVLVGFIFIGCGSSIQTMIKKRSLDVQTKMSASVFLEPVSLQEQIVYVRVRNTTDKDIDIESLIKKAFEKKGYIITKNPREAMFMVQANLLQIGKSDENQAQSALVSGFGGAIVGTAISRSAGHKGYTGGLIGATVGIIGDALIDDVHQTIKSSKVGWKKYRTRVVSTATQVNLKFEEAKPKLIDGLVRSLSGLL